MTQLKRHFLLVALGMLLAIVCPKPAQSAERIYMIYGPLKFSLSIDSLEIYAKEGKITKEFAFYADRFEEKTLSDLRQALQKRYYMNQVDLYRFTHTPIAEDLLKYMGRIISTHYGRNGFYAIRGALISAAANKDGWTAIDVMRNFPTKGIWINTELAMELLKEQETIDCNNVSFSSLLLETSK
jgi:hypothetical protein